MTKQQASVMAERASFEAWMRFKNWQLREHDLKWSESDGSYENTGVNAAWNRWQARAAQIVSAKKSLPAKKSA